MEEHPMTTIITRHELVEELRHGDVVLLEALPEMHFDAGHVPGAQNLPLDDVEALAPVLVPDQATPIVTYCTGPTCANSKIAATRLEALGYRNVRAYEAGKEDWVGAGLPVESTTAVV
jgi:rhodanese-related sulfurtransferase